MACCKKNYLCSLRFVGRRQSLGGAEKTRCEDVTHDLHVQNTLDVLVKNRPLVNRKQFYLFLIFTELYFKYNYLRSEEKQDVLTFVGK